MRRKLSTLVIGLAFLPVAACAGTTTAGDPGPSVAPASPTPLVTASPDEDFTALKPTVLGADDIGNGWKARGEVGDATPSHRKETATTPVEYCPGHVSEVFKVDWFAAAATRNFSKKVTMVADNTRTTTDATLYVSAGTLPAPDATGLRAAYDQDVAACREYKVGDDLYVVMTPEGVSSLPSADEVVSSFSVQRYSDKAHKKLASVGQYTVARSGRVVALAAINTLPGKDNGRGKDFTEVGKILAQQLQASKAAIPA